MLNRNLARLGRLLAACAAGFLCAGSAGCARASWNDDGFEAERYYYFIRSNYRELNRDDAAALKDMVTAAGLGRGSHRLKMEAARLYSRTGDNRTALRFARDALALAPEDPAGHLLIAWLAGAEDDQETAEREYLKVLELNPDNTEAMYWLGALYFDSRRHQEAEKIFKRLVKAEPSAVSYYRLGHLYHGLGRTKEAIRALTTALEKDPDFPDALDELARLYEATGRNKAAERAYRRLMALRPGSPLPANSLARLLLKLGRRKEAEKLVEAILKEERRFRRESALTEEAAALEADQDNDSPDLTLNIRLGLIYLSQKLHREAIGEFEAVLKARPDHARARYLLASALLERAGPSGSGSDSERAFRLLEAIEPASPLYTDARLLLASATKGRDERDTLEKSLALLEAAGRARPDSPRLWLVQARILELLSELEKARGEQAKAGDELEKARALLLKAAGSFPGEAEFRFRLGVVEDQLGHKAAAIEAVRQAIDLNPRHADALNYLAYTWAERRENLTEALELAQKADALKPGQGYIIDTVAWIYHQMGQPRKALPLLKRAVPLSSRDPVVLDHLGDVLVELDRTGEALEAYRQALEGGFADQEELHEKIRKISP
jgi:tetratricopeptide (TPR) repeat protein